MHCACLSKLVFFFFSADTWILIVLDFWISYKAWELEMIHNSAAIHLSPVYVSVSIASY